MTSPIPTNISKRGRIIGGLWGSVIGDALGVPVEFKNRSDVQLDPVKITRECSRPRPFI